MNLGSCFRDWNDTRFFSGLGCGMDSLALLFQFAWIFHCRGGLGGFLLVLGGIASLGPGPNRRCLLSKNLASFD